MNAPTKRSSGHKKLNPFFMTEAELSGRREGAGAGADGGSGPAVARRNVRS